MKKKNVFLLSSLLTFSALTVTTLASCNNKENGSEVMPLPPEEVKYKFSIENDDSIGTIVATDSNGNLTSQVKKDEQIFVKVDIKNTDYTVHEVTVGSEKIEFNSDKKAYVVTAKEDNFIIKISYKLTFANLNVNLKEVEGLNDVKIFEDEKELGKFNFYKVEIGKKIGIKLSLKEDKVVNQVKANDEVLTLNKKTGCYEFIMPNKEVSISVTLSSITKVQYFLSDKLDIKYLNGTEETNELPKYLPIGQKVVFKGTIADGYIIDTANSGVSNYTIGLGLSEKEAIIEIEGNNFTITIFNVEEFEYKIQIITRKPGKYENQDFLGTWGALKGVDPANDYPSISLGADGTTSISLVHNVITNSGTYELKEDGTISATYTEGSKKHNATILPLRDENGVYAVYVSISGGFNDRFLGLRNASDEVASVQTYLYKNSNNQYLVKVTNNNTKKVSWIYHKGQNLALIDITSADGTSVTDLVNGQSYYAVIGGNKFDFKYQDERIIMANFEKGIYTSKAGDVDNLVLDGYGNYTLGAKKGTYTFDPTINILVIKDGEKDVKVELDLIDKTYCIYVPKANHLTGFTYSFDAVDPDPEYGSTTTVDLKFVSDKVISVYAKGQCENIETSYLLTPEGHFEASLPFVSGNKQIVGDFNETFTQIKFETTKLIWEGDMANAVGKLIKANINFTSSIEGNKDVLKVYENGTFQLNDEVLGDYFLEVSDKEVILKGEKHYKLNLIDKTFESLEKKPGNWFIWKTFEGTTENTDVEPGFRVTAKVVFDNTKPNVIKSIYIRYLTLGWGGTDNEYRGENLTYTYDKETNIISIPAEGTIIKLKDDERLNSLKFTESFYIGQKYFGVDLFSIKGK